MSDSTCLGVPDPRRIWTWILVLIAASYLLDGGLLAALSASGVVPAWVILGYVAAGLASCGLFYALIVSGLSERARDGSLAVPQLVVAVAIQLLFMALAPAVAWYFVGVLFVVFGFASLRLRPRHAVSAVLLVASALVAIATAVPEAMRLPANTPVQRFLVVLCTATLLVRCTLLGIYGSQLRVLVAQRWSETRRVLDASERRGAWVASALQEGLGQELTGTSLMLSACARRLRLEGHPGAPEIEKSVEHLREAIRQTQVLAQAAGSPEAAPAGGGLASRLSPPSEAWPSR